MKVFSLDIVKTLTENGQIHEIEMPDDVFISREAKRYLTENHIKTVRKKHSSAPAQNKKPEYITSLNAREIVAKNHPRILFRGKLDTFQAEILEAQLMADKNSDKQLAGELEEILSYCRDILSAEVLEMKMGNISLFGMNDDELRYVSQHPKKFFGVDHIPPDHNMGEVCVALNLLRARSREVELAGVQAFYVHNRVFRNDILKALNRLSSAIYIIYCRYLSKIIAEGRYEGRNNKGDR